MLGVIGIIQHIGHLCCMMLIDDFCFSFQGSLKVGTRTTSMKYIQPEERERSVQVSVIVFSVSVN